MTCPKCGADGGGVCFLKGCPYHGEKPIPPECTRCQDTGVEQWSGRIVGRDQTHISIGPCLRCNWRLFWRAYDAVGLPNRFLDYLNMARRRWT